MICYRDRSFCASSVSARGNEMCINEECSRCITDDDRARAEKHNLPFSVSPFQHDGCGYIAASPSNGDEAVLQECLSYLARSARPNLPTKADVP